MTILNNETEKQLMVLDNRDESDQKPPYTGINPKRKCTDVRTTVYRAGLDPASGEFGRGFAQVTTGYVPDGTEEIVDTMNHAAGQQPFYPRHESGVEL